MIKRIYIFLILTLLSTSLYAGTLTDNLNLYKPAYNESGDIWWSKINDNFDILDAHLEGWVNSNKYASINAAVTAIGSTSTTLVVTEAETLTANLTIPSTLRLVILKGGSTVKASTYTLTINGSFESGLYKVFTGFDAGNVTFGSGAVKEVYPEWWGAKSDGTTDNVISIQSALNSLSNGGIVQLTEGIYKITDSVTISGWNIPKTLQGVGYSAEPTSVFGTAEWLVAGKVNGTVIKMTGTGDAILVGTGLANDCYKTIKDLAILGPGSGTSKGIKVNGNASYYVTNSKLFDNVLVANFYIGVSLDNSIGSKAYNLSLRGCGTGMLQGAVYVSTDTYFYAPEIQACATGIEFRNLTTFHFYGGLIQGNTIGINFNPTVAGMDAISFDGIYFEGNTNSWVYSGTTFGLSNLSFINCRDATAWTFTVHDTDVLNNISFINDRFDGVTIDLTAWAGGYGTRWSIIGSNFKDIITFNNDQLYYLTILSSSLVDRTVNDPFFTKQLITWFTSLDTTPSIFGSQVCKTQNGGATVITTFNDGYKGQTIKVLFNDANTTIDFTGTNLKGNAGADWSPANGDWMECIYDGTNWYCSVHDCTA